ncbi:MAG: potassium channel family protein [Pseudomonadota bacterium]
MQRPRPIRTVRLLFGGVGQAMADPKVRVLLGMTFSLIGIATVFYHLVEGWALLDAAYFSTVTIATVGYGDFAPKTVPGKVFTIGYVLVGIGMFVAAGTALADHLIRRAWDDERERRKRRRLSK